MLIQLDPEVKKYLIQKHAPCITLRTIESKGGCGIPVEPQIELALPQNLDFFDYYEVDGVDIYIKKGLHTENTVYFKLSSLLGLKSIRVSGLSFL